MAKFKTVRIVKNGPIFFITASALYTLQHVSKIRKKLNAYLTRMYHDDDIIFFDFDVSHTFDQTFLIHAVLSYCLVLFVVVFPISLNWLYLQLVS